MSSRAFENKVAIVTGAGRGIGFEISRQLASQGARVILNDLDPSLTVAACSRIRADGGICEGAPGDTSDLIVIDQLIQKAVSSFGQLNIVIANAGITLFGDFLTYSLESFNQVLNVNLKGNFFLAQRAALLMKEQATGGSILFTSSATGHQAHKDLAAYSMTKAALEMLAKNLVVELSGFNITVNAVAPGATLTERTENDASYASTWAKLTPLGRAATVIDIAHAALFLVSDLAKHITGQTIIIDGGWTSVSPLPY